MSKVMKARVAVGLQILIAILLVLGGLRVAVHFIETAPRVGRKEAVQQLPRAAYRVARRQDLALRVRGNGVVRAAREVTLRPRVTGLVEWVSEKLEPGEIVEEGEVLVRLDRRDYELALRRAQENLEQAETLLEIEEGRHRIARTEWDMFSSKSRAGEQGSPLALRLPQLASARSAVASARTGVEDAELGLSRTVIRAPFTAFVEEKRTEVGQLVSPSVDLVKLVGVKSLWVELPLPPDQLARLSVPGVGGEAGARGVVRTRVAGESVERRARVVQLLGSVDPAVRFARVLVEVQDPFDLSGEHPGGFPLLLGSYVEVALEGRPLQDVIPLPRAALQEGRRVYGLDAEDRLRIHRVRVVWEEDDRVWVDEGIEDGDRYVVSAVTSAIEGLEYEARPAEGEQE